MTVFLWVHSSLNYPSLTLSIALGFILPVMPSVLLLWKIHLESEEPSLSFTHCGGLSFSVPVWQSCQHSFITHLLVHSFT
jgi:hypothetical protein